MPKEMFFTTILHLTSKEIMSIGEINSDKIGGKVRPGSNIPIVSENEVLSDENGIYLMLPWHLRTSLKILVKFKDKNGLPIAYWKYYEPEFVYQLFVPARMKKVLYKLLKSFSSQTIVKELIIIDDSSDRTRDIINLYISKNEEKNIRLIEGSGEAVAHKKPWALDHSKGILNFI